MAYKILLLKVFFFFAIVAISVSLFAPCFYSWGYNTCSLFIFIVEVYTYFKVKDITNYFCFDVIFLFVFGISAFAYPVFFYLPKDPFLYFFNLSFDVNCISKSVSLSLIASTFYMIGGLSKPLLFCYSANMKLKRIDCKVLTVAAAVLIFLFCLLGGISQIQSTYKKDIDAEASGGVLQIMALLQAVFIVLISTAYYNKRLDPMYKFDILLLLEVLFFSGIMFYAGNRTYALILLLPLLFYYTAFYHKIKFYQLLLLMPIAFMLMWVIQVSRTGNAVEDQTLEVVSVFKDIVIPSRSNYIVYEVVEKEGFTYGETMSGGIIGVIPSLERILKLLFNLDSSKINSASYFTFYTFGDIGKGVTGLGTMLQADAFLSFGILGVAIVFFFIGYLANNAYLGVVNFRYYAYIVYSGLIAHSIFWVRADATYPVKTIVWGVVIAYLNKYFVGKEWRQSR